MTPDQRDGLIQDAHAGKIGMRQLRVALRCDFQKIYRRMAALGLPYRKPDCRTRPSLKRDYLRLVRPGRGPSHADPA